MNFVDKIKEDLNNIKVLIQDRNFKQFWRPALAIIVMLFFMIWLNGTYKDRVSIVKKKIEAQQAESDNEKDYKVSKTKYQNLLAQLPPSAQKNEWILLQLEAISNKLQLKDSVKYVKGQNTTYGIFEISTAIISGDLTYNQIGRLVETIENNPQFLRINKLSLNRQENALGKISVRIEVYTAFLEEHKVVSKNTGRKK